MCNLVVLTFNIYIFLPFYATCFLIVTSSLFYLLSDKFEPFLGDLLQAKYVQTHCVSNAITLYNCFTFLK
jgi:hypothetical protein